MASHTLSNSITSVRVKTDELNFLLNNLVARTELYCSEESLTQLFYSYMYVMSYNNAAGVFFCRTGLLQQPYVLNHDVIIPVKQCVILRLTTTETLTNLVDIK